MSKDNSNSTGGVGFLGALTILFIGLKLTGHIDWSWWWVLSPIWLSTILVVGIFVVFLILKLILDER